MPGPSDVWAFIDDLKPVGFISWDVDSVLLRGIGYGCAVLRYVGWCADGARPRGRYKVSEECSGRSGDDTATATGLAVTLSPTTSEEGLLAVLLQQPIGRCRQGNLKSVDERRVKTKTGYGTLKFIVRTSRSCRYNNHLI